MAMRATDRTLRAADPARSRRSLRRAPLPAPLRPLVVDAVMELIPMKSIGRATGELAPGSRVSVTCSPAKSIEATLDEVETLLAAGHHAVPHLAARMVESSAHLRSIHGRLVDLGVREIFVVAGDAPEHGCFFDAIEFIDALLDLDDSTAGRRAIDHVGVTAYPDRHPAIDPALLHEALHRKQERILGAGRTGHASTQMCFSADRIAEWLRAERSSGLELPVHLGVPGVIDRTKLIELGLRLGVGTSLRYLDKNRRALGTLLSRRFEPDVLLRPLAGLVDELGIEGLHVFTFNQVAAAEEWRRRHLRSV